VASDMIMVKEAEAERSSMVRQHVMLMYGIFYMFMAVAVIIIFVLVPMLKTMPSSSSSIGGTSSITAMSFNDPCSGSGLIFPCAIFSTICSLLNHPEGISCYYLSMFFTVILLQGLLMGLIAGQLGENSVVAGTKHSLIMVFSTIGIFLFLAKAGLIPV